MDQDTYRIRLEPRTELWMAKNRWNERNQS